MISDSDLRLKLLEIVVDKNPSDISDIISHAHKLYDFIYPGDKDVESPIKPKDESPQVKRNPYKESMDNALKRYKKHRDPLSNMYTEQLITQEVVKKCVDEKLLEVDKELDLIAPHINRNDALEEVAVAVLLRGGKVEIPETVNAPKIHKSTRPFKSEDIPEFLQKSLVTLVEDEQRFTGFCPVVPDIDKDIMSYNTSLPMKSINSAQEKLDAVIREIVTQADDYLKHTEEYISDITNEDMSIANELAQKIFGAIENEDNTDDTKI